MRHKHGLSMDIEALYKMTIIIIIIISKCLLLIIIVMLTLSLLPFFSLKDRLPDRHLCLNLCPCVINVQSVSQSLSHTLNILGGRRIQTDRDGTYG